MIQLVSVLIAWGIIKTVIGINDALNPKDKKSNYKPNHYIMQRKITRRFFKWW